MPRMLIYLMPGIQFESYMLLIQRFYSKNNIILTVRCSEIDVFWEGLLVQKFSRVEDVFGVECVFDGLVNLD